MTKLCARGKSAAKRKFKVYPSAYANAYASKICAGKIKDPSGVKRKDWGPKKASLGSIISSGKGEKIYRKVLNSKLSFETDPVRRNTLIEYASVPLSGLETKVAQMRLKEKAKKPLRMQSGGSTGSGAASSSSGEAKVKKVISGLQKASRTHTAQAKTLQSVVKASDGQFAKKLQSYDGSYMRGDLAGHKVSNKSLTNYYKGMIDG